MNYRHPMSQIKKYHEIENWTLTIKKFKVREYSIFFLWRIHFWILSNSQRCFKWSKICSNKAAGWRLRHSLQIFHSKIFFPKIAQNGKNTLNAYIWFELGKNWMHYFFQYKNTLYKSEYYCCCRPVMLRHQTKAKAIILPKKTQARGAGSDV